MNITKWHTIGDGDDFQSILRLRSRENGIEQNTKFFASQYQLSKLKYREKTN